MQGTFNNGSDLESVVQEQTIQEVPTFTLAPTYHVLFIKWGLLMWQRGP